MCHAWGQASPAKQGEQGYAADGINRWISRMLTIIVETMDDLSVDERAILGAVDEHAMWHTFGTQSVADAVQKVLGHASPQTTLIFKASTPQGFDGRRQCWGRLPLFPPATAYQAVHNSRRNGAV
jgi:hypothetical protein